MSAPNADDGPLPEQDDLNEEYSSERPDLSDIVYISADGMNPSAPWLLRSGGVQALTPAQCAALAERFGFTVEEIRKLSNSLAHALDPSADIHLVGVSRSKAITRAATILSAVSADLKAARARLEDANHLARDFGCADPMDPIEAVLWHLDLGLERMRDDLEGLLRDADLLTRHPEIMSLQHDRPSTLPDRRRRGVLLGIKSFLERNDRRLGYTTDPHTSERKGPLVDFVNAVVECVTDPPTPLSPHTIVKDFRSFGPWRTSEEVAADLSAFMEAVRSYRKP